MREQVKKRAGYVVIALVVFIVGLVAGVLVMNKNKIFAERGASDGTVALLSFQEIAGDSYVEVLADLKEVKKSKDPIDYLTKNSTYVLDEEAIEVYVESYITAAESTAQATGVTIEKLIVEEWGYESIDAYRAEAKELSLTFIKERLAVYQIAKDKKIKVTESDYKEQLADYARKFGYATTEEFEYACTPVSIANEMLYEKVVSEW